ncbi:MAG TPA: sodium:solute symporter family protein [Steroidobacteraceae bacterium]|jgi:SSS family solute:Na+ symporter|nr:sodium:solute symporter family protein [Steroidobacteraceae bacterium]
MTPATTALTVIVAIVTIGAAIGFLAGSRQRMDLEQWTVGGRGFGTALVFLLMAGEVYTTFTFLGVSGWAYSRGGPVLYALAYLTLAYVASFFFLPQLWEIGRKYRIQTQADFFNTIYRNPYLAGFVCIVGILAFVPYIQLQLDGIGIIVSVASFGHIGRVAAMTVATVLVIAFVVANGVRAIAWVSVLKDLLMLVAAIAIGVGIPLTYFGGIGATFAALAHARPEHLVMPGSTANLGHSWYISTVLLTACGFYMWPHTFGATFTARSADILRRNAVLMPIYSLTIALMFFAGFAAVLILPHLQNGDLALLTVVRRTFPPWFLGVVGGAGALTAMVPAAILLLTAATLFAKNLYRPLVAPAMSDDGVARLARAMVVLLGAASLALAIHGASTLVSLLLAGYAMVAQCLPGVLLGLYWRQVTAIGVFSGIVVGVLTAASLMFAHLDPIGGLNAGFVALCSNFVVAVAASLATRARPSAALPELN